MSRCFTLKSTPIVDWMCSSKESSVNRRSIEDWKLMILSMTWRFFTKTMTNISCRGKRWQRGTFTSNDRTSPKAKILFGGSEIELQKTYLSNRSITNDQDLGQVIIRKCLGWRSCWWRWHLAIDYRDILLSAFWYWAERSATTVAQEDDVVLPGGRSVSSVFRLPIKAKKRAVEALSSNLRTKLVVSSS